MFKGIYYYILQKMASSCIIRWVYKGIFIGSIKYLIDNNIIDFKKLKHINTI